MARDPSASRASAWRRPAAALPEVWPGNDTTHVYLRLLEFALQLRLVVDRDLPGKRIFLRNTAQDLGHFAHSCVQLEVAGLAMRGGWDVRLEPDASITGSGKADLLLSRAGDTMAVEVKTFTIDDLMRNDLDVSRAVSSQLFAIETARGVQFDGTILQPDTSDERDGLMGWLSGIDEVASRARDARSPITLVPPTGGQLTVAPDELVASASYSFPIRARDPLRRLFSEIRRKAEQARGDGATPLWLRFDVTAHFLMQLVPAKHPAGTHTRDRLLRLIELNLALYPHVAGLVLSSNPMNVSSEPSIRRQVKLVGGATGIACTTHKPWTRSTFIIQGPRRAATRAQYKDWISTYLNEGTWLAWALEEFELPPIEAIIR